jgi:hypothetical protein
LGWRHSVSISTASSTSFILERLTNCSDRTAYFLSVYLWNAELVATIGISVCEYALWNWFRNESQ